MKFEFATAHRIIFGPGRLNEGANLIEPLGDRIFIITGGTPARAKPLLDALSLQGKHVTLFCTETEPTVNTIRTAFKNAQDTKAEVVIGFGGGSAIDAAKAVAILLTNKGDLLDYVEIIGKGRVLTKPPLPWIAIPTTAGSGAEVTRNAVIASPEHRVKVSLRSDLMLPSLVITDPELTYFLPPHITANTGIDALTQLIESYVSNRANPITDGLCLEGIRRVSSALLRVYKNGKDIEARENMSIASLLGGIALANSKLGAVHGIAGPMGGMLVAPHGALCASLILNVMMVNIKALYKRFPYSDALRRYKEIARILTSNINAQPVDGIAWIENLCKMLKVLPLSAYGLHQKDFNILTEKAMKSSSMQGNPVSLTEEEVMEILKKAF